MQTKKNKTKKIARGIVGGTGAILYFHAVTLLPLGDAVCVFSVFPVFTAFLAWIFFKEKLTCMHVIALILSVAGVILISRPQFIFNDNSSDSSKLFVVL